MPDTISILVVNAAFPFAMVVQLAGMRRFLGLARMSQLWYAVPLGAVVAAAVFYYGYDSIGWRTLLVSVAISLPHFAMAFLILRRPLRPKSTFYVAIGTLLASAGAVILGRAIWSFFAPHFEVFADSLVQLIFFVLVVVLQLGENLAFIMLNSERVEIELLDAEIELRRTVYDLQRALAEVKTLSGLLPICSVGKKIRDDQGYWQAVEHFIQEHTAAEFSHGICPECLRNHYPEIADKILSRGAK